MAKGYPDWRLNVDVSGQLISEIINRPKFGGAQVLQYYAAIPASQNTSLGSVEGKGMVYGGFINVQGVATQKADNIRIYVDGTFLANAPISMLNAFSITSEHSYPIYELSYDNSAFIYNIAFSHGITFETSIEIKYEEMYGRTPTVSMDFIYALI